MRNVSIIAAVALALSACAVGPDYERPDTAAPAEFARADSSLYTDAEMEADFWRQLDDPMLTALVDDALAANHDLRIALARYDQARALLRESGLDRFPTVTAGATAADRR
ncbi:MAG: TolC family protein, partial [Woeseiaceae bacterium]